MVLRVLQAPRGRVERPALRGWESRAQQALQGPQALREWLALPDPRA